MLVLYGVLVAVTEGGTISVASGVFWDLDFRKSRRVGISGMKGLILRRGVKVDFGRSDDVNGELGV